MFALALAFSFSPAADVSQTLPAPPNDCATVLAVLLAVRSRRKPTEHLLRLMMQGEEDAVVAACQ